MTRVFVYGSLLAGLYNHRVLRGARFIGEAMTTPHFRMHDLGSFPGIVAGGEQSIAGELYEVDAAGLAALDRLEGHPSFYCRTIVELTTGETAETYLLNAERVAELPVVSSGSWKQHCEETS